MCGDEDSAKTFGEDSPIFWGHPCPVPAELCPEKGTMATWVKKSARIMYKSDQAAIIKVNVPNWASDVVKSDEYIGFLQFSKVKCGNDFIDMLGSFGYVEGWENYYFIGVDMFDYEAVYHWQYRHRQLSSINNY